MLYRPQLEVLERLLRSLEGQVEGVHVVDNTPAGEVHAPPVQETEQLRYFALGSNRGLAAAQNVGLQAAIDKNFTHVLLLDQDSELSAEMVRGLLAAEQRLLQAGHSLAAVGAMYVDAKTGVPAPAHRYHPFRFEKVRVAVGSQPVATDWLISSGSLIRTEVLTRVGLMREDLFIDLVDTEWGLRARHLGLLSFLIPEVSMAHSIGDDVAHLLGRKLMLHGEARVYYMLRNNSYLMRVPTMGWKWRSNVPLNLFVSIGVSIWLSKDRRRRMLLLLRALSHGLLGRLGPWKQSDVEQSDVEQSDEA